jgi:hypothetical protein
LNRKERKGKSEDRKAGNSLMNPGNPVQSWQSCAILRNPGNPGNPAQSLIRPVRNWQTTSG